jgi:hypothetical protein
VEAVEVDPKLVPRADNQASRDWVVGVAPHFFAYLGNIAFAVHSIESPYMKDPIRASESISELRLRKAVREHKAWLSIDIIQPKAPTAENYRVAGRVLAGLIGRECVALYHPPLNKLVPCGEDTLEKLRGEDPIRAVFQQMTTVPVVPVGDDPRLKAAEAEARRRFPEFEAAFRAKAGDDFSVKAPISRGGNTEHIWILVDEIHADRIEGRLG